jgi:hypothetical protein
VLAWSRLSAGHPKNERRSPSPYMFGFRGKSVMTRRYCGSKTMGWRPVENSTSFVCVRTMEKENGELVYLNWMSAEEACTLDAWGRGNTASGTCVQTC